MIYEHILLYTQLNNQTGLFQTIHFSISTQFYVKQFYLKYW